MEDEVSRLKGEVVVEKLEPEINIPLSVYLPESYISDLDQRLMAYRRLAKMSELKDISDFKDELSDRYGSLPVESKNLLLKIMLKILSIQAGVKKLDLTDNLLFLTFSGSHQKNPLRIFKVVETDPKRYLFTSDQSLKINLHSNGITAAIGQAKNILIDISKYVNN